MIYTKCPECNLNYVKEHETYCSECLKKMNVRNNAYHETHIWDPPLTFTVINEKVNNIKTGFSVLIKNQKAAVLFAHDIKDNTEGQAELCFFPAFYKTYGKWRKVFINKFPIMFSTIEERLKKERAITFTTDERHRKNR